MGQVLHGSARTTEAVRRAIQHSQESLRVLAKRHGINQKTVAKWKKRTAVKDLPTGPKDPRSTVLSIEDEAVMVAKLERRDLARAGAQLSRELGLAYVEPQSGERIEGRLDKPVTVGDGKYALIQKSREFTLVPWRPTLEKQVGKEVAGIVRSTGSISWTIGRSRGLGID